ncbi:MAG: hypothetical protein ACK5RY_14725 [Dolichospermum sp.]|nr:hypothetical protein [Anabaena sp. 49628_E55]
MTREQGTGNREQGTEKRFRATLLFVTYVGFFPFTYLVRHNVRMRMSRIKG